MLNIEQNVVFGLFVLLGFPAQQRSCSEGTVTVLLKHPGVPAARLASLIRALPVSFMNGHFQPRCASLHVEDVLAR